jgi:hypothetical protein
LVTGCEKHAHGGGKCVEHGGGRRCPNCITWIDSQIGIKKYDGMCYRCYAHEFPDDLKVQAKQRAEATVKAYINSHFAGFIHCIETDEHHHRYYKKDDEDARYHDMLMAWGGKLCFIRFNPDDEGPPLEERLERLHAEMTLHIGRLERGENSAYLEVWHLYYPEGTSDFYDETCVPEWL